MKLNNLHTQVLGKNFEYYEKIDSTQKEIWSRVTENRIENGTVICAGVQESGVGTHGRVWHTDEKNNIAFSFYLNLNVEIEKLDGVTLEIAEIIRSIFEKKYNILLKIKKPNDIVYNQKKIGGILTETKLVGECVRDLVVGIGINTNQTEFADEIHDIATSIKNEFGFSVDNEKIISEFCNLFEKKVYERIK